MPVYLEAGKKWVFACAVDWPGWARRGKDAEEAVTALQAYHGRYQAVVGGVLPDGPFEVIGTLPGGGATDFGVPAEIGEWDRAPADPAAREAALRVLDSAWAYLDGAAATAPAVLRKGPRGGGRDRDAVVEHVRAAERAYGPKVGVRLPAALPWAEHRVVLRRALQEASEARWPFRYSVRRLCWHILDHAWEIEDRSEA